MAPFVRPAFEAREYRDDDGRVIKYGNRWGRNSPPEESYSRTSNLDRYEPLQVVARALIDYLASTYDVTLDKSASPVADFLRPLEVLEAVRVSPLDPSCASLTFGFTSTSAVFLHAGVLRDFAYPSCRCDACDEGIGATLDRLEWTVFAVTDGNFRESVTGRRRRWAGYEINTREESESGSVRVGSLSKDRIKSVSRSLAIVPDWWAAWPLTIKDKIRP
jgi:hypothetical protein